MLFVGNRFGGDAKDFCEQLMMVADALILPVNLLGWIVESVSSSHFEDSHVSSTCWSDEVDIVSPSSHYRVGRDASMAIVREVIHELNPHLRHRVTSLRRRISDESVRRTRRLSTCRLVRILIPKVAAAAGTFPPCEVLLREEWNREFFGIDLRQLASLLDFASKE